MNILADLAKLPPPPVPRFPPLRRPYPDVPRVWEPEFVGPRLPFRQADMYDPRENVAGRTYWGD